jgi:hypothetical protein
MRLCWQDYLYLELAISRCTNVSKCESKTESRQSSLGAKEGVGEVRG